MFLTLVGYSVMYFLIEDDMTGFTISAEIMFLFLTLIPLKRYFSTLETPLVSQIILFILGILLNYGFGIVSFLFDWNKSVTYTVWWVIVNVFILSAYTVFSLLRDKGAALIALVCSIISFLMFIGIGIALIVGYNLIAEGIAVIAVAIYYGYAIALYFIYLWKNKSIPWFLYPISIILVIITCFAVMIYAFVVESFNDFYGFSLTYLVINFLLLLYSIYLLYVNMRNRFDRPNFFSPYGNPVFKFDPSINSVV
eukprot:GHVR01084295.1.p1 GENE.GHVR01084295.1~~GHVR01084295.1.p1  ORF type:complete len:253 (+),score=-7.80 GHVR01084295.1:1977-2735(+)